MKVDKRKLLGPFFAPLSKVKHSNASRMLVATLWMPSQILRARHNRPYFAVDISSAKGMGALISEALLMCKYAEMNGLIPHIVSTNPLYAGNSGKDFLRLYLGQPDHRSDAYLRPSLIACL
jgi:hypothetical protein